MGRRNYLVRPGEDGSVEPFLTYCLAIRGERNGSPDVQHSLIAPLERTLVRSRSLRASRLRNSGVRGSQRVAAINLTRGVQ
jgi:hypothetical protein